MIWIVVAVVTISALTILATILAWRNGKRMNRASNSEPSTIERDRWVRSPRTTRNKKLRRFDRAKIYYDPKQFRRPR